MMKRFWIRLIIFMIPIVIVLFSLISSGVYLKQLQPMPIRILNQQHSDEDWLYKPQYIETIIDYKFLSIVIRRPEVVVIGTSRMFWLRDYFFNHKPDSFYNASIPTLSLPEAELFIAQLEDEGALPPIIIFGLEYTDFNGDNPLRDYIRHIPEKPTIAKLVRNFIRDFAFLLFELNASATQDNTGLFSWEHGYLPDGSYYTAGVTSEVTERNIANHRQALAQGQDWYMPGQSLNEANLAILDNILSIAERNDVEFIGVLPPMEEGFYQALITEPRFSYILQVEEELATIFREYDYPLINQNPVTDMGVMDGEFYDSYHPGEVLTLRMYLDILRTVPDILGSYSDEAVLEQYLAEASDPIYLNSRPAKYSSR